MKYNYYFYSFRKNPNERFFSGVVMDLSRYRKEIVYYNTLHQKGYDVYNQTKLGMGLSLGFKNYYGTHIFIELKTSVVTKIYNYIFENGRPIMSLDA